APASGKCRLITLMTRTQEPQRAVTKRRWPLQMSGSLRICMKWKSKKRWIWSAKLRNWIG
ncbi:unnamed protein product, partial [Symbiodinium sp. KB8]